MIAAPAPLARIAPIRRLLASMAGAHPSDLFLCEGKRPSARIHGALHVLDFPPTRCIQPPPSDSRHAEPCADAVSPAF